MAENDLEKLKKKLYQPGKELKERLEESTPFQIGKEREKVVTTEWQEEKEKLAPRQKKKLKTISILALVVFFIIAGFFFWRGLNSFDKDKVKLEIKGAERIISGDEVRYIVKYRNETKLSLTNLSLVFRFPENSIFSDDKDLIETIALDDLAPGQEAKLELSARLIGLKGETKKASAELFYQPGNLSSRFSNKTEFETEIISVPLILDFDLPERLVDGQSFTFSLHYSNQSEVLFESLQIRLEYPEGFVFESSQPNPSENEEIWSLGELMAGEQGKIFIKGSLKGEEGENKKFKAQLGVLNEEEFIPYAETLGATQISASPLSIKQTVNKSDEHIAEAGEKLKYEIEYKNTTDIGIKNVFITAKLEGAALDLTTLDTGLGSFDSGSQTITWNAASFSDLEYLGPHQEGKISFSVEIKNPLPINSYKDKEFSVVSTIKIDSDEVPLSFERIEISGQSKLIIKIISHLTLQAQAFYYDDLIANTGPVPPKVNERTTYTIKWRLINRNNDLRDVKVEAFLPPHIDWMNVIKPAGTNLNYDSRTGRVLWQAGDLPAGTGILSPVRQVAFQVAITPNSADAGSSMELIGQSKATAYDKFVGIDLTDTARLIDTSLPDDPNISGQGRVVE